MHNVRWRQYTLTLTPPKPQKTQLNQKTQAARCQALNPKLALNPPP